jgi:hypothetical protein
MSGGPYALGIDFGTESVRVGIFDMEGAPIVFTGESTASRTRIRGGPSRTPTSGGAAWSRRPEGRSRKATSPLRRSSVSPLMPRPAPWLPWTGRTGFCVPPSCGWTSGPSTRHEGSRRPRTPGSSTTGSPGSLRIGCLRKPCGSRRTSPTLTSRPPASASAWIGSPTASPASGQPLSTSRASAGTKTGTRAAFPRASTRV